MIDLMPYSKGYCLQLSDGSNWWITGDEENKERVDKFASIMRLQACPTNNAPKIILSKPLQSDTPTDCNGYNPYKINSLGDDTNWSVYDSKLVRIWYHNIIPDVICEVIENSDYWIEYVVLWNLLLPIYWRSTLMKGIPFHAGLAEYKGNGVLFAASGGTGKSTCCRRLPNHWKPLCDDEVLIVLDKNNVYKAHPFPTWSDYIFKRAENTWNVQYSVPLSAIFLIEQSPHDEVIPLSAPKVGMLITESSVQVWNRFLTHMKTELQIKIVQDIFNNAFSIARSIPTFRLCVSLTGRFWEKIEELMK